MFDASTIPEGVACSHLVGNYLIAGQAAVPHTPP
jgi:hypothetical protein